MAVTPLVTLVACKTIFETAAGDTSQDNIFNLYIDRVSQAICDHCGLADFGLNTGLVEIKTGNNTPAIWCNQIPVVEQTLTGNTTAGSAVITGLASTTGLFVNQSVISANFPAGSFITAIGSGQVTVGSYSQQAGAVIPSLATATATLAPIIFGIAVWKDDNALGGAAPKAFAPSTMLREGVDFWVDSENGAGSPSASGVIYSANSYWFRQSIWVWPLITPQVGPAMGNVKVQYSFGYSTLPIAVTAAAELMLAGMRESGIHGRMATNLGDGRLSVGLSPRETLGFISPEVSALLARYRKVQIGE